MVLELTKENKLNINVEEADLKAIIMSIAILDAYIALNKIAAFECENGFIECYSKEIHKSTENAASFIKDINKRFSEISELLLKGKDRVTIKPDDLSSFNREQLEALYAVVLTGAVIKAKNEDEIKNIIKVYNVALMEAANFVLKGVNKGDKES